ncbi:MAG: hypothetical protein WCV91_04170 [Candidatus Margulisiibacteriota bacterium]
MGLREVVRGTGQGSWFQHGRFFGVHNPLGGAHGKASDPFINLRTLARLSNSSDARVRSAVVNNLLARFENSISSEHILFISSKFNTVVLLDLILQAKTQHEKDPDYKGVTPYLGGRFVVRTSSPISAQSTYLDLVVGNLFPYRFSHIETVREPVVRTIKGFTETDEDAFVRWNCGGGDPAHASAPKGCGFYEDPNGTEEQTEVLVAGEYTHHFKHVLSKGLPILTRYSKEKQQALILVIRNELDPQLAEKIQAGIDAYDLQQAEIVKRASAAFSADSKNESRTDHTNDDSSSSAESHSRYEEADGTYTMRYFP